MSEIWILNYLGFQNHNDPRNKTGGLPSTQLKFLKCDQVLRIREVYISTLEWHLQAFKTKTKTKHYLKMIKKCTLSQKRWKSYALKKLMAMMNFTLHAGSWKSQDWRWYEGNIEIFCLWQTIKSSQMALFL